MSHLRRVSRLTSTAISIIMTVEVTHRLLIPELQQTPRNSARPQLTENLDSHSNPTTVVLTIRLRFVGSSQRFCRRRRVPTAQFLNTIPIPIRTIFEPRQREATDEDGVGQCQRFTCVIDEQNLEILDQDRIKSTKCRSLLAL